MARTCRLALAVIDVKLDDMRGPELAARLKALDDRLLLVMTARDRGAESEILAREAGIVYYAPKPIDLRRLRAVVAKALGAPAEPAAPGAAQRRDTDE